MEEGYGGLRSYSPASKERALTEICVQALTPFVIYTALQGSILGDSYGYTETPASPEKARPEPSSGSKTPLIILTTSALAAVYVSSGSNAAIALGLSHSILSVLGFVLVQRAYNEAQHQQSIASSVIHSPNGLLTQPTKPPSKAADASVATIRDVSAGAALATSVAALTLESWTFGGLVYWGLLGQAMGEKWVFGQGVLTLVYALGMIVVNMAMDGALLLMVSLAFLCACVQQGLCTFLFKSARS